MKPRVGKDGLDWMFLCQDHDEFVWADSWTTAYEAALGHVCMHHPPPACEHEYSVINPWTNVHRCLGCKQELSPILEPPC